MCWTGLPFLIAMDYFSGYVELRDMSSTTCIRMHVVLLTLAHIKVWYSTHGISVTVISENRPPFNSGNFETFSREWEIHHINLLSCRWDDRDENSSRSVSPWRQKRVLISVTCYLRYEQLSCSATIANTSICLLVRSHLFNTWTLRQRWTVLLFFSLACVNYKSKQGKGI